MKQMFFPLVCLAVITGQSCKKASYSPSESTAAKSNAVQAADVITDSSLLCYLPFKGNLKDKSGYGNNGSLMGGLLTYVADRFGNASGAVFFGSSNSWIEIPEKNVAGLKTLTIALDFFPTSANFQVLMSKMSYGAAIGSPEFYQSFAITFQTNAQMGFEVRKKGYCNSLEGWNQPIYSDSTVTLNTWNHLAVTFDNSEQRMYLNGRLVADGPKTASPVCAGEPIRLAVWWQNDPEYFTGAMDEVRIYNRVLSQQEIKRLSRF